MNGRIGAVLVIAVLTVDGALLGAFGLAFTPLYTGPVPVPMGALFSIVILPWLVTRAGEVGPRSAGGPLTAWALVVVVLGLAGPGGDILLPPTWQSLLLVVGGLGGGLWALRAALLRGSPAEPARADVPARAAS